MKKGYYGLCYHYIRPDEEKGRHPRLLGNYETDFIAHVKALQEHYYILSPEEVLRYNEEDNYEIPGGREGVFITFDDGLDDHYRGAEILADMGLKAFFFCPTCFVDGEAANPIIIHYILRDFKVAGFVDLYMKALEEHNISHEEHGIAYDPATDDHWDVMKAVKRKFRVVFEAGIARKMLLWMHNSSLAKIYDNSVDVMHLNQGQVKEMAAMGHEFGGHSHTHASIALHSYGEDKFEQEVMRPYHLLSEMAGKPITALSYPFGRKHDAFTSEELLARTDKFKLAFTVERILNDKQTSPLEIGRYMPTSRDSANDILSILNQIKNKNIKDYDWVVTVPPK